ncbi:hypothetical protein TSPI_00414 [Trichinella spiralis]|uniref:Uncharacterized protein n=1 Tax=Trichinella spiralis TaxID=6334 RepID=A0ABR3KXP3_TRISP
MCQFVSVLRSTEAYVVGFSVPFLLRCSTLLCSAVQCSVAVAVVHIELVTFIISSHLRAIELLKGSGRC